MQWQVLFDAATSLLCGFAETLFYLTILQNTWAEKNYNLSAKVAIYLRFFNFYPRNNSSNWKGAKINY
jgi:hypothetical protein